MGRCANFFFQAEDGIRDLTVTGVQTCALPISLDRRCASAPGASGAPLTRIHLDPKPLVLKHTVDQEEPVVADPTPAVEEIGRASCRERGWSAGGAGAV